MSCDESKLYYREVSISKRPSNLVKMLVVAACLIIGGCEKAPPNGRIKVKNDIQDDTYNTVAISGGGASFRLKPGESALMPYGTTTLYWSRAYKDFTRNYTVSCPAMDEKKSGIIMKLIDVHLNRIAGGCVTTYASK